MGCPLVSSPAPSHQAEVQSLLAVAKHSLNMSDLGPLRTKNIPWSLPCAGPESDVAQGHAGVGHGLGDLEMEQSWRLGDGAVMEIWRWSQCQCLDTSTISIRPPGSAVQRAAKAIKSTSALCCNFEMRCRLSFQLFIHLAVLTV